MAKKKDKTQKKRGGKMFVGLLIFFSLVSIIFVQMTFVLFIVGMLPTIVVYFIDKSEGRSLFHTVMACNLSGVLPFVGQLWAAGNETSDVGMVLTDMQQLLVMYSAAAVGWFLVWVTPFAARLLIASINEKNIQSLRSRQKRLTEEWGKEIAMHPSEFE